MQIGVVGAPGMTAFLSGKEGGDLILPLALKGRLTTGSVRTILAHNIRAGIGISAYANGQFRVPKRTWF